MIRNGLYNVGGQTVRGAIGLFTIPFLIRFLGIREYGVWSLAYALLALMTMSEAGMSVAAAVFLSKDIAEGDSRATSETLSVVLLGAVLLATVIGLFLLLGGSQVVRSVVAFSVSERAEAGRALRIAGLAVFVYIIERALVGIEQAFDRYATINVLDVSQSLVGNVGLVVVAWLGGKTTAMMKWQLFAWAVLLSVHCLFVFRLLHLHHRMSLRWSANKARKILRFSAAAWVSALGTAAFGQCDRLVVGGVLGAPALGIYSAITNMTSKINSFSGTAVQPLVPSLSRTATIGTSTEGQLKQAVHLNALIAIEAAVFLFVLADWIMRVMVPGASVPQNILGLQIATIIYALYSFNAPGYFILFSVGAARTNALVVLASGAASLGLIFLGSRYFGLIGALGGNVGYFGTLLLIVAGLRKTRVAVRRYLSWVALPCLWLAVAVGVGLVLRPYLQWRAIFCLVQALLFVLWFVHYRRDSWMESKIRHPLPGN